MVSQTRQLGLFCIARGNRTRPCRCGGSNTADMGEMKLAVADAPVDGAKRSW